jgi:hypothetical protein
MIYQLFKRLPTPHELKLILNCYNLQSINDNKIFTISYLKYFKTIDKLNNLLYCLADIYLPCKFYYIKNITYNRSLTILRQILKLFNRKIQKRIYGNNNCYYYINCKCNSNYEQNLNIKKNITLNFN